MFVCLDTWHEHFLTFSRQGSNKLSFGYLRFGHYDINFGYLRFGQLRAGLSDYTAFDMLWHLTLLWFTCLIVLTLNMRL
jgi:hypothetical protein